MGICAAIHSDEPSALQQTILCLHIAEETVHCALGILPYGYSVLPLFRGTAKHIFSDNSPRFQTKNNKHYYIADQLGLSIFYESIQNTDRCVHDNERVWDQWKGGGRSYHSEAISAHIPVGSAAIDIFAQKS
jgi:hypothetical protein